MSETYRVIAKVPVEVAYAYVADFPRHVEWSPDSLKIEPSQSGPALVGSTFQTVGLLQGKPNPSCIMHPLVIGPGNRKSMGMLRDRLESQTAKS